MIIGEGETPLYQLITGEDLEKIPNLIYWQVNKYRITKLPCNQENLSQLPSPLFSPNDIPVLKHPAVVTGINADSVRNYSGSFGRKFFP